MEFPHMIRVRQTFGDTTLGNIADEITAQLANLKLEASVKQGQTVAMMVIFHIV